MHLRKKKIIPILLNHGANINAEGLGAEQTPLHLACSKGDEDCLLLLLEDSRGDLNKTDQLGSAPLHIACERGRTELIPLLVKSGADINAKDGLGLTPLDIAFKTKNMSLMKALLVLAGANWNGEKWVTIFHHALIKNNSDVILFLLEAGFTNNPINESGFSAIELAVSSKNIPMVTLLLDHGVDANYQPEGGASPLKNAILNHSLPITTLLLEHGADPN